MEFPIRVPVYLRPERRLITQDGEAVTAAFFAPYDRTVEPYIRIATGDYPELLGERGRNDALAAFIASLGHELVHYRQWVETGELKERGVARRARSLLDAYAETTDEP